MDAGVLIAIIVSCGTFSGMVGTAISQTILSRMAASQRHTERLEDRAERLEIANRASDTATLLARNTKKVAEQSTALLESNVMIDKKLDQVHGLVNSALTTVKQSEYDGKIRELGLKLENIELRRKQGEDTPQEALDYVDLLQAQISDLKMELADRTRGGVVLDRLKTKAAVEFATDSNRRRPDMGG